MVRTKDGGRSRPLDAETIPLDMYSLSVGATFQLASGQTIHGFVGVTTEDEIEISHGVLLHEGEYLFIPPKEDKKDRKDFLLALSLQVSQVFPISYSLHVRVEGEDILRQGKFK